MLGYFPMPSSLAFSELNLITKFFKIQKNLKKINKKIKKLKNAFTFLFQKKIFKCMQDLPKMHRNYSSGAIIWGSLHPTEENILLLGHTDIYNHTPVTWKSPLLNEQRNKLGVSFQKCTWEHHPSVYPTVLQGLPNNLTVSTQQFYRV